MRLAQRTRQRRRESRLCNRRLPDLSEILTNVLRHRATSIDIQLRQDNGHMELQVIDNGKGISDLERVNTGSLGILGMKERAWLVGGEVSIAGSTGAGTTVRVRVPVETCDLE